MSALVITMLDGNFTTASPLHPSANTTSYPFPSYYPIHLSPPPNTEYHPSYAAYYIIVDVKLSLRLNDNLQNLCLMFNGQSFQKQLLY